MNINQLRYFVQAAESRSFTKAAAQNYISQTAITQQIHALENSLGVQLFNRNRRPLELTPAGHSFLRDAKVILSHVDSAVHRVHEASIGFVGNLRIGYTKGYERSNLSEILRSFHEEYPNILVSCHRFDTNQLSSGLFKDEYDIIFTWDSSELCENPEIQYQLNEHSPLVAALYPHHNLAKKSILSRKELKNENILFMTLSSSGDSNEDMGFYQLYQDAGYQPNIEFRSNDIESILMMVAAEQGISILPSYATKKLMNADNLVFIPLQGEMEYVDIISAWKTTNENPVLHRFVEHLKEHTGI